MTKKNKLIISGLSINIGIVFISLIVGCVSWFSSSDKFEPEDVKSSVITSYFDSRDDANPSDGSPENPFVITKPVHLFNLIELNKLDKKFDVDGIQSTFYESHYCFEFGKDFDHDGDKEFYEYTDEGILVEGSTSNYLNMEYYHGDNALSPIGTASHPFMGTIEGHNLTVQNIHISGEGYADVGVFGYVDESARISNIYFDTVDIDVYNANPNEYHPAYHEDAHDFVNVGYIAGHVVVEDSFKDVYINNCHIRNSATNSSHLNNDYGYFGYAQCNSIPVATGTGYSFTYDSSKIYQYFDENYGNISSNTLRLRNDPYEPVERVSGAVGSSGSSYNMVGNNASNDSASHNYSLATLGYEKGASLSNLWEYTSGQYQSLPTEGIGVVEEEPGDVPGDFIYYNGETWDHYFCLQNTKDDDGSFYCNTFFYKTEQWDFNRPFYEWYWNNNGRHYLQTNDSDNTRFTYPGNGWTYFAFLSRPGEDNTRDIGFDGQWLRSDVNKTSYILNIQNGLYVYVDKDTKELREGPYATCVNSAKSMGCKFTLSSMMGGSMTFMSGGKKWTFYDDNGKAKACIVGEHNPVYWTLAGSSADQDYGKTSDSWELVTKVSDLNNNDIITFAYGTNLSSGIMDVMSNKMSSNNRGSVTNDIKNNVMNDGSEHVDLKVVKVGSDYTFFDTQNNGYLYAASSTYDYMAVQLRNDMDMNTHFSISISSNKATITAKGDSTHKNLMYDSETSKFSCFESTTAEGRQKVYIFKKKANGNTHIYKIQMNGPQGCYADYGGPLSCNITPLYYSDRPLNSPLTDAGAHRMNVTPESLGDWETAFVFDAYEGPHGYDSTSTVEIISGGGGTIDGWVRCSDKSDIIPGSEYIIGVYTTDYVGILGPATADGALSCVQGSIFLNNGRVISTPAATGYQFTLLGDAVNGYTFEMGGGGQLGSEQVGKLNAEGLGYTDWYVSIDQTNSSAKITSTNDTIGDIRLNIEENNHRFLTSYYDQPIYLYRKAGDIHDITWIADEIASMSPGYDCGVMDAVGGVSFMRENGDEFYTKLDGGNSQLTSVLNHDTSNSTYGKTGSNLYAAYSFNDCITVKVPATRSLDYGTITIEGKGDVPEFLKGSDLGPEGAGSLSLEGKRLMCENESFIPGYFKYTLSLNIYNIQGVSYCALDKDGKILSSYDVTSGMLTPADEDDVVAEDVANFVLVIGAPQDASKTTKISKVEYRYNASQGNTANFNSVGYRTAVYQGGKTDALGNEVKSISKVPGQILTIEFDLDAGANHFVFINIKYDFDAGKGKYVYYIDMYCSQNITLKIFNYDAQRELVKLNGTFVQGSYNTKPIAASVPPTGGWTKVIPI